MTKFVSDCFTIMRVALGRRNENDPDSSDSVMLNYLNDAVHITMAGDVTLFELNDTLEFTIDETNTTGVYTFNDVGASDNFRTISAQAFITLTDPPSESVSWNRLRIFQDPGLFFQEWGVNNEDVLIPGYPTQMLFYGTEFTFRTIPNTSYDVKIYGYKLNPEFSTEGNPELPFDFWVRYLAYLAAYNYSLDYRYDDNALAKIKEGYMREKSLLLGRTHNQLKTQRGFPRF